MVHGKACQNCAAWERIFMYTETGTGRETPYGFCLRRPPSLVAMTYHDTQEVETVWPKTEENDWCWEFVPRGYSIPLETNEDKPEES